LRRIAEPLGCLPGSTEFATSASNSLTESIITIREHHGANHLCPNATSLQAGSSYTLTATVTPLDRLDRSRHRAV